MHPLVSIIIPAYNAERFISETIESVLHQQYKNFELIVVDDGSTDAQREIIFPFCEADSRVRYVYQANKGVSAARNTGFNISTGVFIAFLDSDDVWLPDNLLLKVEKFKESDYGLVHSDGYLMDANSDLKSGVMSGNEGFLLDDILKWKTTQIPGPSSILVKRDVICSIGVFDTTLSTSADHDFFLRVASRYKIGRVKKTTWKYRLHNANMHKNIRLMEHDILHVYKKASVNHLFHNIWFEGSCYATMYMILAASWAGDGGKKGRASLFLFRALLTHPLAISDLLKRINRKFGY